MRTIVQQIEAVTREPGFIYTLSLILLRDLFFFPEETADIDWHDRLNFQEITLLVGLLVKKELNLDIPTAEESAKRFERVYRLFTDLHKKHHEHFLAELEITAKRPRTQDLKDEYRRIFGSGTMMTEPIFYSGSGAYDFQYLDFAVEKYRRDTAWITRHQGIDVPDMSRIARELKKLHEHKNHTKQPLRCGDFSKICTEALSVFCFEESDLQQFGAEVVRNFVKT